MKKIFIFAILLALATGGAAVYKYEFFFGKTDQPLSDSFKKADDFDFTLLEEKIRNFTEINQQYDFATQRLSFFPVNRASFEDPEYKLMLRMKKETHLIMEKIAIEYNRIAETAPRDQLVKAGFKPQIKAPPAN